MQPEHMDKGSRNERLYRSLKDLGLFVVPIYSETNPEQIETMIVSADLPTRQGLADAGETAASLCVAPPVSSAEVGEFVTSPENLGDNVVDLPSILRQKSVF